MRETLLPREFPGGWLRRLHPRDLAAFQAYRSIPEVGRYQGWSPMSDADALAFLDEMHRAPLFTPGQWIQLGIAEPEADALVGDIGLHLSEDGASGEVGFTLQPSAQGRGLAGRAVREAIHLLFAATSVTRVFVRQKMRSIAVLKCLGASSRQIIAIYMLQVMVLGLAGSLLGVGLARLAIAFREGKS